MRSARTSRCPALGALAVAALMAAAPAGDPSLTFDAVAGVKHYTGAGSCRWGVPIQMTVGCSAFGGIEAEGG